MVSWLQRTDDQQWWEVQVDLPAELHRADCVFYDSKSQQYDNNQSRCRPGVAV